MFRNVENLCSCFENASRTLKSFNNTLIEPKNYEFHQTQTQTIQITRKCTKPHENEQLRLFLQEKQPNREHLFKSIENAPKTLEQGPPGQTHSPRRQTLSEPLGAPLKPAEPPELYRPSSAHTPGSGNAAKKNTDARTAAQLPATSPFRLGRCSRLIPCRWSRCC